MRPPTFATPGPSEATSSLLETLPLVVYTVSVGPDAAPIYIAPQVKELLGIAAEDFTFERLRAGIHPHDREAAFAAFDLADARGEELKIEYRFVRSDGSVVWVEDSSRVTTIMGDRVAQGYLLDITDRKESELTLMRQATARRRIAEIGRASLGGAGHEEVIRMAFDVLRDGLGARAGSYLEVMGDVLVVVDCFGWDAKGAVADEHTPAGRVVATKSVYRGPGDTRPGSLLPVYGFRSSLGAPILLDDGTCVGAMTVHAPLDDAFSADDASLLEQLAHLVGTAMTRARVDERLRRSQRLGAVGQLAAGVAHDFNNLLTAIGGYSELARAHGDPKVKEYLGHVLKTSERARTLTSQLLAFSGKQVLHPRPLRLGEVVTGALPMLAPLLTEAVQVRAEIEDVVVLADEAQLENVLVNLAVNARDAMPEGGSVTIGTSVVDVGELEAEKHDVPAGRYGRLLVSDTGVGIPAELRGRVFEPFFTTKEQGKGTGLGLASVEGVVRQTGGFMTLSSEVGVGTSIAVHLPIGELGHVDVPRREPGSIAGGRVLVVEDEEVVRVLVEEQLRTLGVDVRSAATGAEALRLLDDERFDLVLSDLGLPGMDGALLARAIREREPETRVLLMSGYPHDVVASRGIDRDVLLLQKPFRLDELQDAIGRVLAG